MQKITETHDMHWLHIQLQEKVREAYEMKSSDFHLRHNNSLLKLIRHTIIHFHISIEHNMSRLAMQGGKKSM